MQPRASTAEPLLAVQDLGFTYREAAAPALQHISFSISPGDPLVVMGASGAGKSTLCRCLNGIIPHFMKGTLQGEVRLLGEDTKSLSVAQCARHVGLVFEDFESQLFATNVELEVAFGPEGLGLPREEIARRVREQLSRVGLSHLARRTPASLTKGERQRVAVASVLAGRPEVLIFDEPTTGLDARESRSMMALIDRLNQVGHTVVLVTHAMWLVAEYAHRVMVMHEGKVILDAPTRSAFSQTDPLRQAAIIPPQIVRLSQRLGATALTLEELVEGLCPD